MRLHQGLRARPTATPVAISAKKDIPPRALLIGRKIERHGTQLVRPSTSPNKSSKNALTAELSEFF
jgi:hypothetical protein